MSTAISIRSLSKQYRLGVLSHGVLFRDLQAWWARTRGEPDPNRRAPDFITPADDQRRIEGSDKFWALQDINLDIQQGEAVGTLRRRSVQRIGRNGAGKSTLLKILSRVTVPTKGEVRIKGRITSLLEVGTEFHPEMTGRESIFMNGAILGMTRKEIKSRLDEIVAIAETLLLRKRNRHTLQRSKFRDEVSTKIMLAKGRARLKPEIPDFKPRQRCIFVEQLRSSM